MQEWLVARLRALRGLGDGSSSSSRRGMLGGAIDGGDEEKGGGGVVSPTTTNGSGEGEPPTSTSDDERKEPSHHSQSQQRNQHNGYATPAAAAAAEALYAVPPPVRGHHHHHHHHHNGRPTSNHHSFAESMHSVLTSLHHYKLPRWQCRLLLALVILLAAFLALLLGVSLIYGFGLQFPQITVVGTEPLLPKLLDPQGNVPLRSTLRFENPNIFRIYCRPSVVRIYTDAERTHLLGEAPVPALALHAQERNRTVATDYAIQHIMQVPGGAALVTRVATGKPTMFYTTSVINLRIKGLGFVPVSRHYEVRCRVLKLWGAPGGGGGGGSSGGGNNTITNNNSTATAGGDDEGDRASVADCHGKFI